MNIAFRVDASLQIGSGHVMRCLTLANALRSHGCKNYFLCRAHDGHLTDLIRAQGHEVYLLPQSKRQSDHTDTAHAAWLGTTQEVDAHVSGDFLDKLRPTWLIVDHYALDYVWEQQARASCQYLMAIDDLADRKHICHMLIDQNWYGQDTQHRYKFLVGHDVTQLLGPRYALLAPQYRQERLRLAEKSGTVRKILVFMGGSDPNNTTKLVLSALSFLDFDNIKIKVVVGVNYPYYAELLSSFGAIDHLEILQGLPSLAPLMRESDLMIGAGGATNWERMCLGLPSAILSVAANQIEVCESLSQEGYITYLGKSDEVNSDVVRNTVLCLLAQPDLMRKQSLKMMTMVDGLGAERVCTEILGR